LRAKPPDHADLWGLYLLVQDRRPAIIFELGGGFSTFVFAHAVKRIAEAGGPQIQFWSVDESEDWQGLVKQHMPADLAKFVKFFHAKPVLVDFKGEKVSAFESLPDVAPNFVYVDGGLVKGNRKGADALFLESKASPDYAIQVDGRGQTVAFLQRHLTRKYKVSHGYNGVQTLFSTVDELTS
jgi:hypothetical protein